MFCQTFPSKFVALLLVTLCISFPAGLPAQEIFRKTELIESLFPQYPQNETSCDGFLHTYSAHCCQYPNLDYGVVVSCQQLNTGCPGLGTPVNEGETTTVSELIYNNLQDVTFNLAVNLPNTCKNFYPNGTAGYPNYSTGFYDFQTGQTISSTGFIKSLQLNDNVNGIRFFSIVRQRIRIENTDHYIYALVKSRGSTDYSVKIGPFYVVCATVDIFDGTPVNVTGLDWTQNFVGSITIDLPINGNPVPTKCLLVNIKDN